MSIALPQTPAPAAAEVSESALLLPCAGETLLAILAQPPAGRACRGTGVVIVVGGPQYRAGSHRQFVALARALAAQGWPVLRLDVRGMGDSSGAQRGFEDIGADIGSAIDALCRHAGVARVVLWGLCDGASAALLYLHERPDPRVAGLGLANPWVRSEASLARTHVRHYYRQRLREPEFWRKLLRGGVALNALRGLLANLRTARGTPAPAQQAVFQARMASAWRGFSGPIQLLLSGRDHTAQEFIEYSAADPAWAGLLDAAQVQRADMPGADHTFSAAADQQALEAAVATWLQQGPGR